MASEATELLQRVPLFSGLDPIAMGVMADLLAALAGEGATVLFSSHQLDLVEDLHGHAVADPYRWLEVDVRDSEDVSAWIEAQAYRLAHWRGYPAQDAVADDVVELLSVMGIGERITEMEAYVYREEMQFLQEAAAVLISTIHGHLPPG